MFQLPDSVMYANMPSQIPLPADPAQPQVVAKPILKKDSVYRVSACCVCLCASKPRFFNIIDSLQLVVFKLI